METMSILFGAVAARLRGDEQGLDVLVGGDTDEITMTMFGVGAAAGMFNGLTSQLSGAGAPADALEWIAAAVVACGAGDDDSATDLVAHAFAAGDAMNAIIDLLVDMTSARARTLGVPPQAFARQMCSASTVTLG